MNIPDYMNDVNSKSPAQEDYHQDLNGVLKQNIGLNGFVISSITNADLTVTPILDPNTGAFTTVADLALVGTMFFVTDGAPAAWVGKLSSGPTVLVRFSTAAYP